MTTMGFARNQSGSVAIIFAVSFSVLMAAAGVAVDFAYAALRKESLQRAADAAAIAAAKLESNDTSVIKGEAERVFSANVNATGVTPLVSPGSNTVTVEAAYAQPAFFTQLIGHNTINISARAVARRAVAKPCVIVLDPTANESLKLNSEGKLDLNCKVQVNSNHPEAAYVSASSMLKSQSTCVVGGWSGTGTYSPTPTKCPVIADPLASLQAPAEATGFTDFFQFNAKSDTKMDGTIYIPNTLMKMNSDADMTASPFLTVIVRRLELNSKASLIMRNTRFMSASEGAALIQ